jgi:hypothetical protein
MNAQNAGIVKQLLSNSLLITSPTIWRCEGRLSLACYISTALHNTDCICNEVVVAIAWGN